MSEVPHRLGWGGGLMSEVPLDTPTLHARSVSICQGLWVRVSIWGGYRVTSLIRNRATLGPYRTPVPRILGWS